MFIMFLLSSDLSHLTLFNLMKFVCRRKVIGLDDLINDYYRDQDKLAKKKSKKATTLKGYNSDEEDDKTRMLSKVVNDCQKQASK